MFSLRVWRRISGEPWGRRSTDPLSLVVVYALAYLAAASRFCTGNEFLLIAPHTEDVDTLGAHDHVFCRAVGLGAVCWVGADDGVDHVGPFLHQCCVPVLDKRTLQFPALRLYLELEGAPRGRPRASKTGLDL